VIIITFVQIPDFEPLGALTKAKLLAYGQSDYRPGELAGLRTAWLSGLEALRYSVDFGLTAIICQDAPAAIQAAGIEALMVDQTEAAGDTVAQFLGIPFITVCCALAINREHNFPVLYSLELPAYLVGAYSQSYAWIAIVNRSASP